MKTHLEIKAKEEYFQSKSSKELLMLFGEIYTRVQGLYRVMDERFRAEREDLELCKYELLVRLGEEAPK